MAWRWLLALPTVVDSPAARSALFETTRLLRVLSCLRQLACCAHGAARETCVRDVFQVRSLRRADVYRVWLD